MYDIIFSVIYHACALKTHIHAYTLNCGFTCTVVKMIFFQLKNLDIFLIFAQTIYVVGTHQECTEATKSDSLRYFGKICTSISFIVMTKQSRP